MLLMWLEGWELPKWLEAPAAHSRRVPLPWRLLLAASVLGMVIGAVAMIAGWAESASATGTTVTVQPGQTLWSIAAELHTTVANLAAANGIVDPNLIEAGQVLVVPGPPSPAPAPHTVTVPAGATLTGLARQYGTSVAALAAANGIADPNHIVVGETLVIPSPSAPSPASSGSGGIGGSTLGGPTSMALASFAVPVELADNPGRLALQPDFVAAAATYGVSRALLEGLCWWESGWQVDIVSPTGAVGVCQVEPATAAYVDTYLVGAPLDPGVAAQNIDLAAAYLASLERAAGGDVSEAIAAYYQGLTSVRTQGVFPATAHYVQGIEAYAGIFGG